VNVNATEDELRAIAEVLKLAAILDDRAPHADKPRIAAWAEQIHRHTLGREDLLNGLQAYYDGPSERAIQIGDLIHHSRRQRRDRNEREAEAALEQRAARNDIKAAEDIRTLAAGAVMGPVPKTERLIKAETALQCAVDKRTAQEAIREYFAAKTEARKAPTA
jgi:hypothetical protein